MMRLGPDPSGISRARLAYGDDTSQFATLSLPDDADAEPAPVVVLIHGGFWQAGFGLDLMEPLDADARPKVHDPSLNHIGLWVDDLPAAVEWLEANGMRFTPGGIRKGASGHDICFVHPKGNDEFPVSGEGVLIELVQAPDDVRTALG